MSDYLTVQPPDYGGDGDGGDGGDDGDRDGDVAVVMVGTMAVGVMVYRAFVRR